MAKMNFELARALLTDAYLDGWWSLKENEEPAKYEHRALKIAQSKGRKDAVEDSRMAMFQP